MLYNNGNEYLNAPQKSVALFGMSGLGKTVIASMLRKQANWFHYSVDYRIGTRYLSEPIADNFKQEAMKNPFLASLLRSNSVYIASNITFEDLSPLATFLGKPGNRHKGGLEIDEYVRRQNLHRHAEIAAMHDAPHFRNRAQKIYNYQNFIVDCSGSLCEILDDDIGNCHVMRKLSQTALPVWLEGNEDHREKLEMRFQADPKPMYYRPDFLTQKWNEYLSLNNISPEDVDPNEFITWGYAQLLVDRQPRYKEMAQHWGISLKIKEVETISTPSDFNQLIAEKLG